MLVKWGAGIVDARGSMGGMTISRNRSGSYARARVAPVNPQSQRQSEIRALTSLVSARWRGELSTANKEAWAIFASNVPAKNKLGEVINLSGFNQFCKSNIVSANAGLPFIDAGPTIFTLPGEDPTFEATADAGTGKLSIVFDDSRDWLDEDEAALIVQMGIPVSDSIQFFNGPWRSAGAIEGDSVTPPTSPDANLDVPYEIADDQKIFVRAKILRADGRVSDWFRFDSIVATA